MRKHSPALGGQRLAGRFRKKETGDIGAAPRRRTGPGSEKTRFGCAFTVLLGVAIAWIGFYWGAATPGWTELYRKGCSQR